MASNSNFLPLGVTSMPRANTSEADDAEIKDFVPPLVGTARLPERHEMTIIADRKHDEERCFGRETGRKCEMEGKFDKDERWPITPTLSPPYAWICYIRSEYRVDGETKHYRGTGCLFRPNSDTTGVILTCAHNLYTEDTGEAISVEVMRARDEDTAPFGVVTLGPESFRYPEEYKANPTSHRNVYYSPHDYAIIMLPRESRPPAAEGFGYAFLEDDQLTDRVVQVSGYPVDKGDYLKDEEGNDALDEAGKKTRIPETTMYLSGGQVSDVDENSVWYRNDTYNGQSGSPVWTWSNYNWMVVGVHGWYDANRGNEGCRLRRGVLRNVLKWAKELE